VRTDGDILADFARTKSESTAVSDGLDPALSRLPERQREAVLLHYVEGRTLAEVAQLTRPGRKAEPRCDGQGCRRSPGGGCIRTGGPRSSEGALLSCCGSVIAALRRDETISILPARQTEGW
jgi:hypothetical protein